MRKATHSDSTSMAGILAPQAKKVLPKNYHAQNMTNMRDRQSAVQTKIQEDQVEQPKEWKMKRFAAVESRVTNHMGKESASQQDVQALQQEQ